MRALVVGLGAMGQVHTRALGDLGYNVTTVDPDPKAGADYTWWKRGGLSDRYTVVCIAVPMAHLAEQAAMWSGFDGHLLIEKPGAVSALELGMLQDALQGQRVAVGYCERFNPVVLDLQRRLRQRDAGEVKASSFIRWNGRPSVDVDLDLRSHDVDLARYLGLDLDRCTFDARDDRFHITRVFLAHCERGALAADFTQHEESPVHSQWRSFLLDSNRPASLEDAAAVLDVLRPRVSVAA